MNAAPAPVADLLALADRVRRSVVQVAVRNQAGHVAPSLSCIDILVSLYCRVMAWRPGEPAWPQRDRVVFSKAHGGYGLYALFAELGTIPRREWEAYYTAGSTLTGCVERRPEYGIEAGCGSLGHGLPLAVGMADGARRLGLPWHTFCIVGDGELQEGTTWEACQYAVKHRVGNLTIIVDRNGLQAMERLDAVLDLDDGDLAQRFRGFGLDPAEVDGHDLAALSTAFAQGKAQPGDRPRVVLARTTKGYGLACMENVARFHFRLPTPAELAMGGRAVP